MRWIAWVGLVTVASGCGPLLEVPQESMGDSESTSGMPPHGTTSGGGGEVGVTGAPVTSTPVTTHATGIDLGGAWESSSGSSSGETAEPLCAAFYTMEVFPAAVRMLVRDQDGDGTEELWMVAPGPDLQISWLFGVDIGGAHERGEFPGIFLDMHDIDGDGFLDGTGFDGLVGGPSPWTFSPGEPGFFGGPAEVMDLTFQEGASGFGQVSSDSYADFFHNEDGVVQLLIGDGAGGFTDGGIAPSPLSGPVSVHEVAGDATVRVLAEAAFADIDHECIRHDFAPYRIDAAGFYPMSAPILFGEMVPSVHVASETHDGFTTFFNRSCSESSGLTSIVAHQYQGDKPFNARTFPPGMLSAAGDYDGDGDIDVATIPESGNILLSRGAGGDFESALEIEVEVLPPISSRVHSVDIDGDGADEIVYGVDLGPDELLYTWVDFYDC